MENRLDALEETLGSTAVVEYETGGGEGEGWTAARVGFGDAETIDCETGRTVYTAGTE